jgi:hypothetical protein
MCRIAEALHGRFRSFEIAAQLHQSRTEPCARPRRRVRFGFELALDVSLRIKIGERGRQLCIGSGVLDVDRIRLAIIVGADTAHHRVSKLVIRQVGAVDRNIRFNRSILAGNFRLQDCCRIEAPLRQALKWRGNRQRGGEVPPVIRR